MTTAVSGSVRALLSRREWAVATPALAAIGLMILWSAHDGGYDQDTWYWGALATLALLTAALGGLGAERLLARRSVALALALLAAYVGWSYLSILWAATPALALDGSNRALLYLMLFTLFAALPWTERTVVIALLLYVAGIAAIAVTELLRLLTKHLIAQSFSVGRLISPTGYFNSAAALFTMMALVALGLSVRRSLPALLRGLLVAIACLGLDLALLGQSRGWLFTLPFLGLATIVVVRDRLRATVMGAIAISGALATVRSSLHVFAAYGGLGAPLRPMVAAATRAGRHDLVAIAVVFVVATGVAVLDSRFGRELSRRTVTAVAAALAVLALAACGAGALAATHGHPFAFVKRQWNGFAHEPNSNLQTATHFGAVGSGRYDIWRVAWHAVTSHPVGGLGQDNFGDYYVTRRRTYEEPAWTHSLWLRLLAQTGFVGFALFVAFLVVALRSAGVSRRGRAPGAVVGAACLLPLVAWLVHGSVDWFWEFPALSGPALAFLAMGMSLGAGAEVAAGELAAGELAAGEVAAGERVAWVSRIPTPAWVTAAGVASVAAVAVLGMSYLSVREYSHAVNEENGDPAAALRDFHRAAEINPLNPGPGRIGGIVALLAGDYVDAEARERQAISREPGSWLEWLADGLAASSLRDESRAMHDFAMAHSIDPRERVVTEALARAGTPSPLRAAQAIQQIDQEM
jgi:hypothetical protein